MSIKDTLSDTLKTAMKAKDMDTVKVLRGVQAAIKQIEIDKRTQLGDDEVLQVLQKQIKQRQESLTIYRENERTDLADKEAFELEVISQFLPTPLSEDELLALVKSVIDELGASTMADMGKVMNAVKSKSAGRADPAKISQLVKSALS